MTFDLAKEFGGIDNKFEDHYDKIQEIIDNDDIDDPDAGLVGTFIDSIFGNESKLNYEPWAEAVCKTAPWFFESDDLRKKLFKEAALTYNP